MSNLNKRAKKALEVRLDKIGVKHHFVEADNKIIISDENENDTPITEWEYNHCLSDELAEINDFMDNKYNLSFECEWSGTFGIILETY
jgi:hypothetical protein